MKIGKIDGVKRFTAVLLSTLMLGSVILLPASAETINNIEISSVSVYQSHKKETTALVASGNCGENGDNVKWALYESGTLYIYGSGKMADYDYDYSSSNQPYYTYSSNIVNSVIESGVTSIGDYAFAGCSSLTSIEIPDSVTSIGDGAFEDCRSLTSIQIPDSVTSIGDGAFAWCSKLTSIQIPDSVTSIGDGAFRNCSSLTSIEIPDSVTSIGDGAFAWCGKLTSIQIPNSVTSIGSCAFEWCSKLTSIEIPDSVTSIGDSAFNKCRSLTSIEIPDSVTSIGDSAFVGCSRLKDVYYTGTEEQWKKISIGSNNSCLTSATIHYNKSTDKPKDPTPIDTVGDLDGDGKITSADSLLILRASVKLENFNDTQNKLADVDKDGRITSSDALLVLRHSVGFNENEYIGKILTK